MIINFTIRGKLQIRECDTILFSAGTILRFDQQSHDLNTRSTYYLQEKPRVSTQHTRAC